MVYVWYEIIVTDFKNEREVYRSVYYPPRRFPNWGRWVLGLNRFWLGQVRYSPARYSVDVISHAE